MKTRILRIIACIAVVCTLELAVPPAAKGQITDDYSRLREEIERNATLLDQARELVSRTGSTKARASLETAVKLHLESVRLFEAGPGSGRLQLAGQLALKAREALLQTIAQAKREGRLEEDAQKAIDRAGDRFERARRLSVETGGNDDIVVRKTLDDARSLYMRAQDNMREHLFETALRLAHSSEELSNRAISILTRDGVTPELAERAIERTNRVLERLADDFGPSSRTGRQVLTEALDLQRQSREHFDRKDYRRAAELTRLARRIAGRAAKLSGSETKAENAERAIKLTDMLVAEARNIAADRQVEGFKRQVERAGDLQAKARGGFQRGEYESAMKLTLKAREVLKNAVGAEGTALDENEVRGTLVATDSEITRIRELVAERDNPTAKEILERAVSHQDKAWQEFSGQRLRPALVHTRMARSLAQRAYRMTHEADN